MSWPSRRLEELGTFKNGVNFSKDAAGDGRPFINVKDITGSHRFSHEQLDLVRLDVRDDYLAMLDDLFFVRSSVKLDGIGLVGKLNGELPEDGVLHCGFVIRMRPCSQLVDSDYLMYLLLTPLFRKRLKNLSAGAAIINISQGALKTLEIPLPPIPQQQRVAQIVSTYDNLIENNRRRIQLLEQAARLLYKEWFVHLRFPGHEHVKIRNGIPEEWEKKLLSEIATTNAESYRAQDLPDEINYIDISSVAQGRITAKNALSSAEAPGRARRQAKSGDVIWSNVRPNLRAYALIIDREANDVFSTGFTVLSPVAVPFSYLYLLVTADEFVSHLVNHATGVSYPAVRPDDFERAVILVPSNQVLELFHEKTSLSYRLIAVLEKGINALANARDLLLPCLMNGEVAV